MFDLISSVSVQSLVHDFGLWIVFLLVTAESTGVPVPGETALVSAALYAGMTQNLSIAAVVATAAVAAVVGDNLGYLIGRIFGYRLLESHGFRIGLTAERLRIGQYLFHRHGGKIVFFGRFFAFLRTFTALLAGVNRMRWRRFLVMNAAGGTVWAVLFGGSAYFFGERLLAVSGPIGLAFSIVAILAVIGAAVLFRRFEPILLAQAGKWRE